jgi:uncharacterized protein YueI
METTKYVKKLFMITHDRNVDNNGKLMVDNQRLPYEYSKLYVSIDINPRSYEDYIELSRKIRIRIYGIYKEIWFYEFEPSYKSCYIQISKKLDINEDIFWDIKAVLKDIDDVYPYGLILHARKHSDVYDSLKQIEKKAEQGFIFRAFENIYLKGCLHETNIVEKVYLYTFNDEEELKEFLYSLIGKKVENLLSYSEIYS